MGFGRSERSSEIVFSIAIYPRWVSLFFAKGVGLPDPHKRLHEGSIMSAINIWAVLVAAVCSFLLGGLWYSPVLFHKLWNREAGRARLPRRRSIRVASSASHSCSR